ncbi:MAG: branched-chain amino acid transport system ATP-binding protein [Acidobacteriota bacterium]|jgi:branched-chain amino acid transport system ATP-binding protein|nr:branched-chain amino acid transport system ATP-binding protein [Acidobacteriota bacterium]
MLLSVEGVSKRFGGVVALHEVSLKIDKAELVGLLGLNGSGKSTLMDILSGSLAPDSGSINFAGYLTTGESPFKLARRGLSRVLQRSVLPADLSVFEQVAVGLWANSKGRSWETVYDWLDFVALLGKRESLPSQLSYYEQRKVELARALVSSPAIVLVDELTSGFSVDERVEARSLLASLKEKGIAALVIEHSLDVVESIVDRVVVLDAGKKIFDGSIVDYRREEMKDAAS